MLSMFFFFFKQKTAYEMRISDWSSDVCSSDLVGGCGAFGHGERGSGQDAGDGQREDSGLHRDASPSRAPTHAKTRVEARTTCAGPRGSCAAARVHVSA